jgi:hypothetical protein
VRHNDATDTQRVLATPYQVCEDNAARGIALGVLIGAIMWAGIIASIIFLVDSL